MQGSFARPTPDNTPYPPKVKLLVRKNFPALWVYLSAFFRIIKCEESKPHTKISIKMKKPSFIISLTVMVFVMFLSTAFTSCANPKFEWEEDSSTFTDTYSGIRWHLPGWGWEFANPDQLGEANTLAGASPSRQVAINGSSTRAGSMDIWRDAEAFNRNLMIGAAAMGMKNLSDTEYDTFWANGHKAMILRTAVLAPENGGPLSGRNCDLETYVVDINGRIYLFQLIMSQQNAADHPYYFQKIWDGLEIPDAI